MKKETFISWLILISLSVVWGSSFILIKKSLGFFNFHEVGILRITITFLFLSPFALGRLKNVTTKERNYLILSGLIGNFIPAFLFAIAQTGINSSLAGILNSLTPLFTLLLGLMFFKTKGKWYNILGVFTGLIGAIGLIYSSSGDNGFVFNISFAFYIIIATICYAFNVNFIKTYLKNVDAISITALSFFYIGIPSLLYVLIFSDIPNKLINISGTFEGLGYLSILAIVGTGIAMMAFNKLIKISSAIFASSTTYLIPVIAIIWGIIDGEIFKISYLLWFALIITGILMVNSKTINSLINRFKGKNTRLEKN